MIPYPGETTEQRAERARLGLVLTPYSLPPSSETDRAMAWELASRYVGRVDVPARTYGGDCLALGYSIGVQHCNRQVVRWAVVAVLAAGVIGWAAGVLSR